MKFPNNAGSIAGLLVQTPRAAVAAAVLVLVLGVGYTVLGPLFSDDTKGGTTVRPAFQKFSDDLAEQIGVAFSPYQEAIKDLTAKPEVLDALTTGSDETRAALAARLTPQLDGVLALRLLPPDYRDPVPSAKPPLTYASVSMLNHAR